MAAYPPNKIANTYNRYAPQYDVMADENHWTGPDHVARVVSRITREKKDPGPILDVGGGTGLTAGLLKHNHPDTHVTIIDLSEEMLMVARDKQRTDFIVQGNANHLPFEDESFGVTVATGLLNYVDKTEAQSIINEMTRVTWRGGLVAFTCITTRNGWVPPYIAQVMHDERDLLKPLDPHWVLCNQQAVMRVKNGQEINETVFAALVR